MTYHHHARLQGQPQSEVGIKAFVPECHPANSWVVGWFAGTRYIVDVHTERMAYAVGEESRRVP